MNNKNYSPNNNQFQFMVIIDNENLRYVSLDYQTAVALKRELKNEGRTAVIVAEADTFLWLDN